MSDILLDVRGLMPPEPLERVMDALDVLTPATRIVMLIDREPLPLYRILERNGYHYRAVAQNNGDYRVEITLAG
ncbi:MAG: DUF2249 domain-containing protein [Telluria sp.]